MDNRSTSRCGAEYDWPLREGVVEGARDGSIRDCAVMTPAGSHPSTFIMLKTLVSLTALSLFTAFAADQPARPAEARGGGSQRPAPITPSAEQLSELRGKLTELNAAIQSLKDVGISDDLIVDVEAAAWVTHNTLRVPGAFVNDSVISRCLNAMNDALRRASEIRAGTAAWPTMKGRVNRAYRSRVDGTAQPYSLTIPASYDPAKPIALYVYLHGRSQTDPDLGWASIGGSDRETAPRGGGRTDEAGPQYIRVNAFGRSNNSFRWAGETDVLEVIESVRARYNIDPDRILLAGFSMGGAGAWQLGLRRPDLFCGLEINAGVIGTRFPADRPAFDLLQPEEKAAIVAYGMTVDHARSLSHLPIVAFAGENDSQLAASVSIREQLVREGFAIEQTGPHVWQGRDLNALFLVHPDAGHAHPTGETQRLRDEFNAANFARGRVVPDHIRYVTYSTRYNRDHWVTIEGLERHFNRSTIDARRDTTRANYTVATSNISRLRLNDMTAAQRISIDGDNLRVAPAETIVLQRTDGRWSVAAAENSGAGLRKRHGLQGPVNDAFLEAFLCVMPTGEAYNEVAARHGRHEFERFAQMFTRDFLGEARAKADTGITDADIAAHNLVLFGDPGSNRVLARIVEQLPIKWTKDSITVGSQTYRAADHVPVLIYPNPLNPERYVVINAGLSGQGRGAAPAFGDFAVLKPAADINSNPEIVTAGVFDENWQLQAAGR